MKYDGVTEWNCEANHDDWTCECGRPGREHTLRVPLVGGSVGYATERGCNDYVPKHCPHGFKWGHHTK